MSLAVAEPTIDADWGDNRLQEGDAPIHNWYRFVLAFPPHLVRSYLDRFDARPGQTLLDPFCGTGTTLVEGKSRGLDVIGLDVNPIACLAARVKTSWDRIESRSLREALSETSQEADRRRTELGLVEPDMPLFTQNAKRDAFPGELPRLPDEQQGLLLKGSVSPRPLARLLVLRDVIREVEAPRLVKDALLLALAKCAVSDASNLGFGPEVYVQNRKKQDVPVLALYERQVRQMASDLDTFSGMRSEASSTVIQADSREMSERLPSREIDFVITSPPYPNEKDYTRAVRLELVLMGYLSDRNDLRALKESFLRSNSRNIYVGDQDDEYVRENERVEALARKIEARRLELGKTSGFERMYHRVVRQFFGGMARHLATLREHLEPGARCAYVVGDQASFFLVHIHTGQILAEIAEDAGYDVLGIDLWRERRSTASGALLREEVVVVQWRG